MVLNRVRPFKADVSNDMILQAIKKNASPAYQNRIPDATKAGVQDTLRELTNNRPFWNEFVDALVNRIGLEIYRAKSWANPLANFKIGQLEFGDTIEEIMVGLLDAHTYDPSREYMEKDLFGTERPEVQTSFHKVNRRNFYKITVNEPLLRQAFVSPNGLSNFISQAMNAPLTSDNWDEFLLMTSLFASYQENGGFFNVNVPDISAAGSTEAQAKTALRAMRQMGGTLPFISRHYNAAGMPTFANQDELHLFITPEANAAIDVEALAAAFNIAKADMPGKTTIIPRENFGIPGAQAIMTTSDFFVIADQEYRTESQYNPVALQNNYFLHHWQAISYSRFVPAVLFSTNPSTQIQDVAVTVDGVETPIVVDHSFATVTTVERGASYGADSHTVLDPASEGVGHVTWVVDGSESPRTYITQDGTLYVGVDEASASVTVTAAASDGSETASTALAVTGDVLTLWPDPAVSDAP